MATFRPTPRYEEPPEIESTHYARPVTGEVVQGLTRSVLGLHLWRGRKALHVPVTHDPSTGDSLVNDSPDGVSQTIWGAWRTAERAEHAYIRFCYQLNAEVSGGVATVVASLEDLTGVSIDGGCKWELAAGTLPASERRIRATGAASLVFEFDPRWVSTGVEANDGAATPSFPRPLTIPLANRDAWVAIKLVATAVRIWSFDVFEFPEAEITL